jgi:hypothetical protein
MNTRKLAAAAVTKLGEGRSVMGNALRTTLIAGTVLSGIISVTVGTASAAEVDGNLTLAPTSTFDANSMGHVRVSDVRQGSRAAQISFDVPKDWVVQNEQTLYESGFIVPPEPLFALVASPAPAPSSFVLQASAAPWLFVTVEDPTMMLPPSQTYKLMPEYLVQAEPGYYGAKVKTLVAHHSVHQGGLSGSTAALMVVSLAGSTSFDELAYEKGGQLWLIAAGCSASCYDNNGTVITQIVDGVRVGTAA